MRCKYCVLFTDSDIRNDNKQHFCRAKAKMVHPDDDHCEKFDLTSTYHCLSLSFCTDVKICTARLNQGTDDCKKCRQRQDILEIRRFLGRQSQPKAKILIRRENLCERTETL